MPFDTTLTIARAWDVIHRWLDQHDPVLREKLNPPASVGSIEKLEKLIGLELPADFKASYLIHDGCDVSSGLVIGVPLLSLDGIANEWRNALLHAEDLEEESLQGGRSYEPGKIKEVVANPKWIPFAGPDEGNYVGLDFDPGPAGIVGQVINFGDDQFIHDTPRYVMAPSFRDFLHWLCEQFASGEVRVANTPGYLETRKPRSDGVHCSLLTGLEMLFGD